MAEYADKKLIIITGSSGLIGSRLASKLSDDYQVIGLDKVPNLNSDKRVENIGFDITSDKSIKAAFERIKHSYGNNIASVIHLAAYYDFNGEDSPLYDEITVKGTQRFIQHLKSHFNLEQFIFSSTNLIYKPCEPGEKLDEDSPLQPDWAYPESKKKTEELLEKEHDKINLVLARIAGVYDSWCHSIPVSHQIARIYEKNLKGHLYSGNSEKGNPFVHIKDLVSALEKMVDSRSELNDVEILNISEPKTYSYAKLQDRIGMLIHGEEWTTIEIPKPVAKAGAAVEDTVSDPFIKPWMIDRAEDHYAFNIAKAKDKINWTPEHDIYKDLEVIINNLKQDPEKWYRENNLEVPESTQ